MIKKHIHYTIHMLCAFYFRLTWILLIFGFSIKVTCAFLVQENIQEVSGKVFKDNVVNRKFLFVVTILTKYFLFVFIISWSVFIQTHCINLIGVEITIHLLSRIIKDWKEIGVSGEPGDLKGSSSQEKIDFANYFIITIANNSA